MPPDMMVLILSYLHIEQYETVKKVFQLARVSKRMYQVMKEVFINLCARKPRLIRNVVCGVNKLTVLESIQITSRGPIFDGCVEMCPHCFSYYCKLCKDNWCTKDECIYCSECCMNFMACDHTRCSDCGVHFSTIAMMMNNEREYDSDDSGYTFLTEDVISDCDCNNGHLCILCHD